MVPADRGHRGAVLQDRRHARHRRARSTSTTTTASTSRRPAAAPACYRYSGPFPTSADAAGGCGKTDPTGAPMADEVAPRAVHRAGRRTCRRPVAVMGSPDGTFFVSSVITGVIAEYDADGEFVRTILEPPRRRAARCRAVLDRHAVRPRRRPRRLALLRRHRHRRRRRHRPGPRDRHRPAHPLHRRRARAARDPRRGPRLPRRHRHLYPAATCSAGRASHARLLAERMRSAASPKRRLSGWSRGARNLGGMARRLAQLAELDVTVLKGVGAKHAGSLREAFGIETVLDLLTHYPRNYIDRSRQARLADLGIGDEAMVLVDGRSASRAGAPAGRGRRRWSPRTSPTAPATCGSRFFNQAWRERQLPPGTAGDPLRQGRQLPGPPADDEPGRRPGRRPHRPHHPDLPAVREAPASRAGTRPAGWRRCSSGPASSPSRCPRTCCDRLDLVDRTWAFRHIHAPEALDERDQARRRLVFDELLRLQLALVLRKRAVEREAKGIQHTPVEAAAGSCAASTSACRSRSPAPSSGRIARDHRRPRRPAPDAPAPPGRRRLGQDRRRGQRAARRRAGRPPGRARWRRPRCWPSSTTLGVRVLLDGLIVRRRRRQPLRRAADAGRAAHQPHAPPTERKAILAGLARGRGRHRRSAPTRSSRATSASRRSASSSSTSSTASVSSSGPRCATRATPAPRPTCSS